MIKTTPIPKEYLEINGRNMEKAEMGADKLTISGIDEIQSLSINPFTTITMHSHETAQWELWVRLETREAFICMPGEKHELVTSTERTIYILAIKGKSVLSYEEFQAFFERLGIKLIKGSVRVSKW